MLVANRYAEMRQSVRVREEMLFPAAQLPNELEIQARWFAGEFGRSFIATDGRHIEIVQFGTWNREAGPDFRDVAIRIDDGETLRGCVELDVHDRSWETHGHATNPAFEDTVLHVFLDQSDRTFFTRTHSNRQVPQVRIDLAAYADAFTLNIPLARPGRCHAPLKDLPEDRVRDVLEEAARFRLQKKAARLRQNAESHGKDEALFQELAAALGYKENKLPFMLIAQRLPLRLLRDESANAEALLFGFAGFLGERDLGVYADSTRNYVRTLWDRWWPRREEMERLILLPKLWHLSGTRPTNHPQRRLAALALVAARWSAVRRAFDKGSADSVRDFFEKLEHPFWNVHYTLTSAPAKRPMALVGESRVTEILANIFFAVRVIDNPQIWSEYIKLPASLTNRRVETAAVRLFGTDPRRPQFMRSVAHQQGLTQIYEDFCLQDDSDCSRCPFPEQLAKW